MQQAGLAVFRKHHFVESPGSFTSRKREGVLRQGVRLQKPQSKSDTPCATPFLSAKGLAHGLNKPWRKLID